jgi:multidrug efflux pump subunit AcrB
VSIDRRQAEELGVAFDNVSRTLRAAINGGNIVDLNVGDQGSAYHLAGKQPSLIRSCQHS